jgi:predicted neuraminidase
MESLAGSPEQADVLDKEFHLRLFDVCGNRTLRIFSHVIARLFDRAFRERFLNPEAVLKSVRDHRALLAALQSGDTAQAQQILTSHIEGTGRERDNEADHPEAAFANMTPDEARAYEKETIRRVADLSLLPPRLNTDPLPKYDYDQLDYGMTIGIARTPKGRLWAAWVGGEDGPKSFMVAATSDDNGETWSKPRLVIDSLSPKLPLPRSVIVGNLWTDPTGKLWFFFDQTMNHYDERQGLWAATCENPDDESPVWSEPRRIWHGAVLNKPTVLSNGEWLLPVEFPNFAGIGPMRNAHPELHHLRGANVFASSDQGKTWTRRGCVRFPKPNWPEHMFVELKDRRVWMLARTGSGVMQSFSSDQGRTWSEPSFPTGIKHPVARFHIRRLASGRILLVKHGDTVDTHEGRSKLTAWLSDDEGKTWQGGLMLDERTGISYPDGFQAPDGTIYISYDRNRSTDGEILLARFTEEDILAKKIVGGNSKLRMLISRPLRNR